MGFIVGWYWSILPVHVGDGVYCWLVLIDFTRSMLVMFPCNVPLARYTAAQKFPFKIAKQASTMNPDISRVHTPTRSSCQSTECFIVKLILDLRLYLCLFKCDVYFLMELWSKWRWVVITVYTENYRFCSLCVKCSIIQFENYRCVLQ